MPWCAEKSAGVEQEEHQCRAKSAPRQGRGGRQCREEKQGYVAAERPSVTDGPAGGGRGHSRRRRSTIGVVKQASMGWARGERNTTRGWCEGAVYFTGTLNLSIGLANGPSKRPHSSPVVLSSAPYNLAS